MSIKNSPRVPITDILSFVVDNRGKTVPTTEIGFPLIATNCILNERLYPVFDKVRYVSEDTLKNWFRAHLKSNDILFVNKGTPGRCCLVPNPVTFCAAQDMIGLRCDERKVYYRYLLMVLRSPMIQKIIRNNHVGLVIPHFKKENLPQLMIPLPSMEEQRVIGDLYFSFCDLIENNIAICADLEGMAKLLYDYWFVQFDFPDKNGKPYKSSGGKMVWNEALKREIPEGWEVKLAQELATIKTGKEDANFATDNGEFAYFTCGQDILKCDTPAFDGRAVLLAGNGDFNVKHYSGKFNAYQRTYVLIPKDNKYHALLYIVTKEAIARFKRGSAGSIVKFITIDDVKGISLLDPKNDSILTKFNLVIDKIEQIQLENQQLTSLRDFLLPMLMNGQVTVKKD